MTRDPVTQTLFQRRIYGTVGLAVLVALYLLVGLTVHDPWRGDDARYFGPVLAILRGESWLFPMLAGEPLADYPPSVRACAHSAARPGSLTPRRIFALNGSPGGSASATARVMRTSSSGSSSSTAPPR